MAFKKSTNTKSAARPVVKQALYVNQFVYGLPFSEKTQLGYSCVPLDDVELVDVDPKFQWAVKFIELNGLNPGKRIRLEQPELGITTEFYYYCADNKSEPAKDIFAGMKPIK